MSDFKKPVGELTDYDYSVCPACGYTNKDTWELFAGQHREYADVECDRCNVKLRVRRYELGYEYGTTLKSEIE